MSVILRNDLNLLVVVNAFPLTPHQGHRPCLKILEYFIIIIWIYIYHGKSSLSKTCFNHHTPKILLHGCIKYQTNIL